LLLLPLLQLLLLLLLLLLLRLAWLLNPIAQSLCRIPHHKPSWKNACKNKQQTCFRDKILEVLSSNLDTRSKNLKTSAERMQQASWFVSFSECI
jgi:hypothetical protein